MSKLFPPLKSGFQKSLKMLWLLAKIIIPLSCLVQLMDHYAVLEPAATFFSPLTSWFGLPGEAILPLLLGFWTSLYASLGVINSISPGPQQITIIGLMLGICHELPIEAAICRSTGLKFYQSILLRLTTALLAGFLLHLWYMVIGG